MVSSSVKRVTLALETRRSLFDLVGETSAASTAGVCAVAGSQVVSSWGAAAGVGGAEMETEDLVDIGAELAADDGAVELVPKLKEARETCAVDRLCWLEVEAAEEAAAGLSSPSPPESCTGGSGATAGRGP